jgi:Bacterial CdiA-CT RNAse A domain
LKERLRREPNISAASTYRDRATAERVVARALAENHARVDQWLARKGSRPNLVLDYRGSTREEPVGRSLSRRSPHPVDCSDAVVVLRSDGQRGFFVLTSYPEARR